MRRLIFAFFVLLLLTACEINPAPATPTAPHSAPFFIVTPNPDAASLTPFEPVTDTPTSTLTETPVPTLTATLPPTLTPSEVPSNGIPSPVTTSPSTQIARPFYTIYATINYDAHTVEVDQSIAYPNQTGVPLNDLVLAVEPMLYNKAFYLTKLSVNGSASTNYSLVSHRLTIPLSVPLQPNGQVTVVLEYNLNIPVKQKANTFGWLSYQTNLTDWYPFIVPYDSYTGWILHDFMPWGEHLVYDSSDFDVNLRFTDPSSAPIIAAPSLAESNGEWTRYRLNGARTFVLSMSRQFLVSESAVGTVPVRSYYFAGHEAAGVKMSFVETQVLGLFSPLFAPYPYPVLNVVELEYNDGQEYDGLCFLSSGFYDAYDGTSQGNLVVLGVHEMAHNWWFGLVGNDQATEPWLDESMALYSERIFFEYNNPSLVDWWWQWRVNYFGPYGYVDQSIYEFNSFDEYVDAVYRNGATFLEDLRARIGDQAFYAFLKDYAAQMSYRRATAADFFRILRQHTSKDFSDLIAEYFQNPH